MTRLFNDPADFADEMVDGFVAANARWVRKATGGVVRSTRAAEPTVALVIGGGSGHYPAFGGLVGAGLAHGAVLGNIFASPSANQVHALATRVHRGRGVLLSYGNYAGDVLHFGEAEQKLRAEGVDCRSVAVTDDIFSAPIDEKHKRRGIAGDLTVFKIAGAAAEEGLDLDDVERLAVLANQRTRTMGVAFTGCTLPGASEPLFTVPAGQMAIGLGIHGEQGIDTVAMPTANELAALFVDRLLAEIPDGVALGGARVVPILNGLGNVKYEELFVVYRRMSRLLAERGLVLVDPQVGEYCTSFDMAGASLTLLWLTPELERLWLAPADTPAFRSGSVDAQAFVDDYLDVETSVQLPPSSEAGRAGATRAVAAVSAIERVIEANVDELGRIDAIAGDGDHGIGMQRGSKAALEAAIAAADLGAGTQTVLDRAADAWADRAGGTSGALWAVMLRAIGHEIGDVAAPTAASVTAGIGAARDGVMRYGKAEVGDKTMVDALVPFAAVLAERVSAGDALDVAWLAAADAASVAAQKSADLLPVLGRARSHGEKAVGTPDPGAISLALIAHAVLATFAHVGTSNK